MTLLLISAFAQAYTPETSVKYGCDDGVVEGVWCDHTEEWGADVWKPVRSASGGFRDGDAVYTSEEQVLYRWVFTEKATIYHGEVTFYAWVPAQNATGIARYWYGCEYPSGLFSFGFGEVDQRPHSATWVEIGSLGTIEQGSICTIELFATVLDPGEVVAADMAGFSITYDTEDPRNQ